ncbi:MAG: ATPase, partial [Bacteroidales bacterium]|nr:ATPase [Bacteroidales bacterium]
MNKENIINPFFIGRYAGERYFCDREKDTEILIKHIENGRNVALISPRRLGKSGLMHHTFAQ